MTVSGPGLRDMMAQETGEIWAALATVDHLSWAAPLRFCDIGEDVPSRGETYVGTYFEFVAPEIAPGRVPRATVRFSNVDGQIMTAMRSVPSPMSVDVEVVRLSTPDNVEVSFFGFQTPVAPFNDLTVDVELTSDLGLEHVVGSRFGPARFLALDSV